MGVTEEPPGRARGSIEDGYAMAVGAGANAGTIASLGIRALFPVLVARAYGHEALGAWVLAWSWIDGLSKFGVLGLDTAVTPEVASRAASGDAGGAGSAARYATFVGLLAGAAVGTAAMLVAIIAAEAFSGRRIFWLSLAVMAPALPAISVSRISSGVAFGRRRMRNDFYSRGVADTTAFFVVFSLGFALGMGPITAAASTAAGCVASACVAWWLARGLVPVAAAGGGGASVGPDLMRRALPIGGYSLLNLAIMRLDVLLLGGFVGATPLLTAGSFGIYCGAAELAGGLRKVRQAFDPIFTPIAAEQALMGDALERSVARIARWTLTVTLPFVLVMMVAGSALLSLYGAEFRAGAWWLIILAVAHATGSLFGVAETTLMLANPRLNVFNSTLTLGVQAVATLALVPLWGPAGAAAAVLAANAVQAALRLWQIPRAFPWRWSWRACATPALAGVAALLVAVAVRSITRSIQSEIGAAAAGVLIYVFILRRAGIDPEDAVIIGRLRQRLGMRPAAARPTPSSRPER